MRDKEKGDAENTGRVQIIDISTDIDEQKMKAWHSLEAQFAQSREIRDELKRAVALKVKAQHELLKQKIGTALDVEKKVIFDQYLTSVAQLEDQFIRKMDLLDQQNDKYEKETREQIYDFFDRAREEIRKWENNPARYQAEIDRLNEQEQKRLEAVKKRLGQVEKKREAILDQTLKIFDSEQDYETLRKKLSIL